ncbi:MAG: Fatty acid oxidation complex subunit alpha [Rhodocyclaceae bacterium]|nr:MAG: 3-hydroxyacyl-CoA dehydrogenase [Rhodocyclaceae bacterium]MBV6406932.1 Fatty acid oxidation complex subunit alpha [Rhodocyclaceae bacterium]
MINYNVDAEGIATLEWDLPGRSQNVLNEETMAAFAAAAQKALADPAVRGIVVASAKADFIAGGDLDMLLKATDAQAMSDNLKLWHKLFRTLETAGKPVAAALNGATLGGGLELALACHYRVAADNPKARFGFPEVTLGLLPGAGGTQRAPRLMGIQPALLFLTEGKRIKAADAQKQGLVHAVVPAGKERDAAHAWLLEAAAKGGKTLQPWDQKGFRIPGGGVMTPAGMQTFMAGNAMLREKTHDNYPAPKHILSCVFEGMQTDIDTGLAIETRYFVNLVRSPVAKNMIRSLFFFMQEANKLARRPKDVPAQKYTKIGMLGAGMMGAGIAHAAATAGLEVVLLDSTKENAEKGKTYSAKLLEKRVAKSQLSQDGAAAVLARIKPTADYRDLAGCELVVEAVFEDRALKADVTKKTEAVIGKDALFASNTSTLPITGLAEASARPANFIGLHFFSPADKMPLVEIIMGKQTSQQTLARSMDFVRAIGKTPIVVNDARGFYTSRVFGTYLSEGMALLQEGVAPALIDNAGRLAGMPVGPLALADEVSIELVHKIARQTKADLGDKYVPRAADQVAALMVEKLNRLGKKSGHGFYEYPADAKKHLWPGLAEHFPVKAEQPSLEQVVERLMLIQSLETVRCLEEGVLTSPQDADVGAILGWGYPPFRGGPIGQIHTMGVANFVAACDRLAEQCGERFRPTEGLRKKAEEGAQFFAV